MKPFVGPFMEPFIAGGGVGFWKSVDSSTLEPGSCRGFSTKGSFYQNKGTLHGITLRGATLRGTTLHQA